jgi:hypothetical protein
VCPPTITELGPAFVFKSATTAWRIKWITSIKQKGTKHHEISHFEVCIFGVLINLVFIHVRYFAGQRLKRSLLFSPLKDRTRLDMDIIPCNCSLYNIHLHERYHCETFLTNVYKIKGKRATQLSRWGTARIVTREKGVSQFFKGEGLNSAYKLTFPGKNKSNK